MPTNASANTPLPGRAAVKPPKHDLMMEEVRGEVEGVVSLSLPAVKESQ